MEPSYLKYITLSLNLALSISAVTSLPNSPKTKTSLKTCNFPAIFNFGDSNSDTGGLSAAFGQAPYPNGETFFHSPAGRFSDGRLIIDFIGGVYEKLLPMDYYFSKALYTFDIGQNDLTSGFKQNMTFDQVKAYIPDVLRQFSNVIKNAYAQGGRSFWVHNTGPLGCLPYTLDRFPIMAAQIDDHGCATPFNDVARFFNSRLKAAVVQLRKDLPLAAMTYVDIFSVKHSLITQAKKLGFENPLLACCGHGGKYNYDKNRKCGSKVTVNGKEIMVAKSCKVPAVRINWDGVHYTEAANKWVYDQIINGSYSDPPIPMEMACRVMDH